MIERIRFTLALTWALAFSRHKSTHTRRYAELAARMGEECRRLHDRIDRLEQEVRP